MFYKLKLMLMAVAMSAPMFTVSHAEGEVPEYYPPEYQKLIQDSRSEKGVTIYSVVPDTTWKIILQGFNKKFPWIKVENLDLDTGTIHSRWEAEAGTGSRTADLLISGGNDQWARYGEKAMMTDYKSPEFGHLTKDANPYPGVMVLTMDPNVIIYNKALLSPAMRPTGLSDLVKTATANPDMFKGRITTFDAARSAAGVLIWSEYMQSKGKAGWDMLNSVGPMIRGETGGGTMFEKVATGEYLAAVAVSSIIAMPRIAKAGERGVVDFTFANDGQPIVHRGMGIPKGAANPASAKILVDYMLSHEGQKLIGVSGMTPYRPDVKVGDGVNYTYQSIVEAVGGEQNIVHVEFDPAIAAGIPAFIKDWDKALGRK